MVLVGEDPASAVYVRSKEKAAHEAGMESFEHRLPAAASCGDFARFGEMSLNDNPAVDGILVQLPLPRHIDAGKVIDDRAGEGCRRLPLINVGKLGTGELETAFVPCTPGVHRCC